MDDMYPLFGVAYESSSISGQPKNNQTFIHMGSIFYRCKWRHDIVFSLISVSVCLFLGRQEIELDFTLFIPYCKLHLSLAGNFKW